MSKKQHEISAKHYSKVLRIGAVLSAICGMILLTLVVLPVSQASRGSAPPPAPSPRPPLPSDSGALDGGGSYSSSAIYGTVTDLSLMQPGAGMEVAVNGGIVRTDTDGRYSITGLNAGDYIVTLVVNGPAAPAQGPVHVGLDGSHNAVINLDYYSQPAPPTDTPQPTATVEIITTATPPPDLPDAGAPINQRPPAFIIVGLLLLAVGAIAFYKSRPNMEHKI